jgi:hypothetical protein
VCGRWPLVLQDGKGGHFAYLHTASSKNAACFLHLVAGLPQRLSTVEYFGGVGQFSTILRHVIHPGYHRVFDLDVDCVSQLQSIGLDASQGDARETMGTVDAELVVLDFPVYTVRNRAEWPLDRVFARRPKFVIQSDTALRRLGLHRGLYSAIFGTPIHDQMDYCYAYSTLMWETYGYAVTRVAHHLYSYFLLEQRGVPGNIDITKISSADFDLRYKFAGDDEDQPRTISPLGPGPTSNEEWR